MQTELLYPSATHVIKKYLGQQHSGYVGSLWPVTPPEGSAWLSPLKLSSSMRHASQIHQAHIKLHADISCVYF